MGGEDGDGDRNWDFHLRTLSNGTRDSNLANNPASDPSLLHSVTPSLTPSLPLSPCLHLHVYNTFIITASCFLDLMIR